MRGFMKTIISALQTWVNKRIKSNTPDWDQNDSNGDGYIKNRPFYTIEGHETIATITENFQEVCDWGQPLSGYIIEGVGSFTIVPDSQYIVIFDGVQYEVIAHTEMSHGNIIVGNDGLVGPFGTDNGAPFVIGIYSRGDTYPYAIVQDAGQHTISILQVKEQVHKLDAKYLPDGVLAQSDYAINNENDPKYIKNRTHYYGKKIFNSTWINNITFTGFSNGRKFLNVREVQSIPKLREHKGWNYNALYTVIWDGKEYSNLTVVNDWDSPKIYLDESQSTYIAFDGSLEIRCYDDYESTNHTITVMEYTDTVTLTKRMEEIPGYSNDIEFPGVEFPPFFNKEIYHVEYTLFGQHFSCEGSAEDGILYLESPHIPTGNGSYVRIQSIYGSNNDWLPNTVQFYSSEGPVEYHDDISITISRGTKLLDEVFIPKSIARVEQLPIIDTTLSIVGAAAEAKAVDISINERLARAKDYMALTDQVNGYTYLISMRNGNLVSEIGVKSIEVTTMPTITKYMHGEYFDTTGMVVTATCYDGTTREIVDYTYTSSYLSVDTAFVEIAYTEAGITHTTTIPVTVIAFDPATILVDFAYTDNGDGTYTIVGWNGTYNGATSTEMIIPNYGCILV